MHQQLCLVCLTALPCLQADVENQGKPAKAKIDKTNAVPRAAAGQKWYDATLTEWPENDFRIFVGDMGNEVNDDILTKAFTKYATFQKAKIVRDKHSNKSKGMLFSAVQTYGHLFSCMMPSICVRYSCSHVLHVLFDCLLSVCIKIMPLGVVFAYCCCRSMSTSDLSLCGICNICKSTFKQSGCC